MVDLNSLYAMLNENQRDKGAIHDREIYKDQISVLVHYIQI